jgi:hypothetical protein
MAEKKHPKRDANSRQQQWQEHPNDGSEQQVGGQMCHVDVERLVNNRFRGKAGRSLMA